MKKKKLQSWTRSDIQYLINNYPTMKTDEMARRMGRTETAIRHKAYMLGIIKTIRMNRRSPEELAKLQKKNSKDKV